MKFVEGIIAGATIGMIVGTMKSSEFMNMYKKGKKYIKRIKNTCCI